MKLQATIKGPSNFWPLSDEERPEPIWSISSWSQGDILSLMSIRHAIAEILPHFLISAVLPSCGLNDRFAKHELCSG